MFGGSVRAAPPFWEHLSAARKERRWRRQHRCRRREASQSVQMQPTRCSTHVIGCKRRLGSNRTEQNRTQERQRRQATGDRRAKEEATANKSVLGQQAGRWALHSGWQTTTAIATLASSKLQLASSNLRVPFAASIPRLFRACRRSACLASICRRPISSSVEKYSQPRAQTHT